MPGQRAYPSLEPFTSPPTPSPGLESQAHSPCPHCCEQNGGAAGGGGAAPPLSSGGLWGQGGLGRKGSRCLPGWERLG